MANMPPPLPSPRATSTGRDPSAPSNVAPRAGAAAALIAAAAIGIFLLIAALVLSLALASVAIRDENASTARQRSTARGERPPDRNSQASEEAPSNADTAPSANAGGNSEEATEADAGRSDADSADRASVGHGSGEGDSNPASPGGGGAPSSAAERAGGGAAAGSETGAAREDGDEPPSSAAALRPGQAFGIDAVGTRVVYVVDCSTDLGQQGYATATDGVVASLGTLRSDQEFSVMLFADDVYPLFFPDLKEETLFPSAAARTRVATWLAEFDREALGRSRAAPALEYALSLKPTDLFFVSGSAPDQETVDAITDQNSGSAVVHAVGVDVDSTETLRSLARRNGGLFREAR